MLINLVGNAVKFSEPGDTHLRADLAAQAVSFKDSGDIHLRVKVVAMDNRGCELHLSVQDHGIGIPLDKQAHIFEPFTQADSRHAPLRRHRARPRDLGVDRPRHGRSGSGSRARLAAAAPSISR